MGEGPTQEEIWNDNKSIHSQPYGKEYPGFKGEIKVLFHIVGFRSFLLTALTDADYLNDDGSLD